MACRCPVGIFLLPASGSRWGLSEPTCPWRMVHLLRNYNCEKRSMGRALLLWNIFLLSAVLFKQSYGILTQFIIGLWVIWNSQEGRWLMRHDGVSVTTFQWRERCVYLSGVMTLPFVSVSSVLLFPSTCLVVFWWIDGRSTCQVVENLCQIPNSCFFAYSWC